MTVKNQLELVLLFGVLGFNSVITQNTAPLITISDGPLQGIANRTVRENVTYYAYRGIPFAKPPVGNLRFAAPVKNDPWKGTLDATKDRDQCVQTASSLSTEVTITGSEDCLHINVYTTNVNGNLPVMVWIYGGGFTSGTSAYDTYAPDYFLEKEIVYVSFNYRLGVFGFLSTEDMEAPGNWGLKDQILALKWVKSNIKNFGGDPNKVTIFGESAGAASVSYLVNSKLTQGLFDGAIMESGTSLCSWALSRNARLKAFEVGLRLQYLTLSSKHLIQHLRTVDYKKLKQADQTVTVAETTLGNVFAGLPFGVVKEPDHPEAVFSSKSWELIKNGEFHRVPLIVGFNSDETAGFDGLVDFIRPVLLKYDLNRYLLPPYDLTSNIFNRTGAAIEISNYFFGASSISSNITAFKRFANLEFFLRPSRELATLASKYTKTYLYEFSYKGLYGDPTQNFTGVSHSEELYYLFVSKNRGTANDAETVQKFVTLWTNFAKTGNPTPQSSTSNGTVLGQLNWIPNTSVENSNTSNIRYLQINNTLSMEINPFQEDWTFYEHIYKKYGDQDYGTY